MERTAPSRATGGAVYAEFLVAFVPLFVFFLCLVQLMFVHGANIVTQHAATKATRAAVVVLHDDGSHYSGEPMGQAPAGTRRRSAIEAAAAMVLVTLGTGKPATIMRDQYGPRDLVTVELEFPYSCRVPIGKNLVCGLAAKTTLHAQASLPNQGATFRY